MRHDAHDPVGDHDRSHARSNTWYGPAAPPPPKPASPLAHYLLFFAVASDFMPRPPANCRTLCMSDQ